MRETAIYAWEDNAPPSARFLNNTVVEAVLATGADRVLDAGCGNGILCRQMADAGLGVYGVDRAPSGVEVARRRVPEGTFEVGSFEDFPIATDLPAIVSTEVIEHLYDPRELLSYCHRALAPEGYLILSTPYHGYLKNLAISLVDGWDKHFTSERPGEHIKFFSRATLERMLSRSGYRIERFIGVGRAPYLWKSMVVVARKA